MNGKRLVEFAKKNDVLNVELDDDDADADDCPYLAAIYKNE